MADAETPASRRSNSAQSTKATTSSGDMPPRGPAPSTSSRSCPTFANFMQIFPFFAAVLAAHLHFWARLAYVPLYAAGASVVRTAAFGVSVASIVLILLTLT